MMSQECKRDRLEQSDMVMILLNLAYIPDEVAKSIDFGEEQWSVKFQDNMQAYKEKFKEEHGVHWQWQTTEVEDDYRAFIEE